MAIKQNGTVAEFRENFEIMAAPLKNLNEETLKGVFINGLEEELQAEVLMANPKELSQIMDVVQRVEDRNLRVSRAWEKERLRYKSSSYAPPARTENRTIPWNPPRGNVPVEKSRTISTDVTS